MAQKYTVKTKDNPLKLASKFNTTPQAIFRQNGINSLTAGQTIKIPSGLGVSSGQAGFVNPASTLPSLSYNYPTTPAPFTTQSMLTPTPSLVSLTNGQTTSQVTNQGAMALGQNTVIPQNNGIFQNNMTQNQSQTQSSTPTTQAPRPTGVYTGGNDPESIAWRRYWNQQAGGTGNESVRPLTRDQIWKIKADQRRRQMGEAPMITAPVVNPSGNAVNSSLSWRL